MERCCDRGFRISVNDTELVAYSTLLTQGNSIEGSAGGAVIYEFESTSDFLTVQLSGFGRPDPNPILSGFTLEDMGDGVETWDSDRDGLIDDWELLYGPDLRSLGNGDADGDGQTDTAEFAAGTNPRAAHSVLAASISLSPTELALKWPSELGIKYRILESSDLSIWDVSSEEFSGTGSILSWPISLDSATQQRFFRVETVTPN
jgi:hypothetical protein